MNIICLDRHGRQPREGCTTVEDAVEAFRRELTNAVHMKKSITWKFTITLDHFED